MIINIIYNMFICILYKKVLAVLDIKVMIFNGEEGNARHQESLNLFLLQIHFKYPSILSNFNSYL